MSAVVKAKRNVKRFVSDTCGNLTMMFAIASVPFVLAAGAAIDFARFNGTQTHVQLALDAATLAAAAGKDLKDSERIDAAKLVFDANLERGAATGYKIDVKFEIKDKKVVSSAKVEMPTSFMAVGGFETLVGNSKAEVNILADKKAEIALVLDYSYSMTETAGGQVKYKAMRKAAKKLVDDLAKSDPDKVKFAIVPFSQHVYTTLPASHVLGAKGTSWTGCTTDRTYPYNLTNSTPVNSKDETKWNQAPVTDDAVPDGCAGYVKKNLQLMDLTNDFVGLSSKLDSMTPHEYTHIAVGVEFGYHVLSPNAPFSEAVSFDDTETRKFIVILTDGAQKAPAFGKDGARDWKSGEQNLESLCENMKSDKITVITMAFDLDDPPTVGRLQNCATDPVKDFFNATDDADITKAFESVKAAITSEVFLSK